jgi:glutathione S-transferase
MPRGSMTVPVLTGVGRTLRESGDIVAHADRACPDGRGLYGDGPAERAEIEALMADFDAHLGPDVRLWMYAWAVDRPQDLVDFVGIGLRPGRRRALRASGTGLARLLRRVFAIGPGTSDEAARRVEADLDAVSGRLADGRRYLVGGRFSAADLTFAALAALVTGPRGYGGGALGEVVAPEPLAERIEGWTATPAARFAQRIYDEHRLARAGA